MFSNLLPIGSVVRLDHGERRLLVIARVVATDNDEIFDYAAVLYPDGLIGLDGLRFFNTDAIECVFALGYQDEEEVHFRNDILANLGTLRVDGGRIVIAGDNPNRLNGDYQLL